MKTIVDALFLALLLIQSANQLSSNFAYNSPESIRQRIFKRNQLLQMFCDILQKLIETKVTFMIRGIIKSKALILVLI